MTEIQYIESNYYFSCGYMLLITIHTRNMKPQIRIRPRMYREKRVTSSPTLYDQVNQESKYYKIMKHPSL